MTADLDHARTLLGVDARAAAADLRRAFRQRALALHPDRNPDPRAPDAFREVREAYDALLAAGRAAASAAEEAEAAAEIAAAAEAAAREAERRRRRAAGIAANWQAVRVDLAPAPALARAAAWLRRAETPSGPLAVEALGDGLRDLRWTVTLAWDEIARADVGPGRLDLGLTPAAAERLAGRVPEGTLVASADDSVAYRLPVAEPARLAGVVRERAGLGRA